MPTALIIEDRRENIVFIANNILKPKGYDIITARDGKIGLKKASEVYPDLIITDIKLPKMTGLEVLEELRKNGIFIPTIVMTFHGTEETARKALQLGARDYLIKPFTFEEMEAALDRALKPQPTTPEAYRQKLETQAKIATLEEEVANLKAALVEKERQLENVPQGHSNNDSKNLELLNRVTQKAKSWERDNARLNEILVEAKEAVGKARNRAGTMEKAVNMQKVQLGKYQQETKRLASELRNITHAVRLMSQDMEQQMSRLVVFTSQENRK